MHVPLRPGLPLTRCSTLDPSSLGPWAMHMARLVTAELKAGPVTPQLGTLWL